MKSFKCICSVCAQNLRKWQTDYRVWCIAVLLLVMVSICADDLRHIAAKLGTKTPIWIFPFLFIQGHTKVIYTLPLILLFCNAPFTDANQTFVFMRSGRMKWLCGQILYIAAASAVYYLFLFVLSVLLTVFGGEISPEWGKTLDAMSITDFRNNNVHAVEVPYNIVAFFKPLQAVWFTFLMSWLGGMFIGLTIFFLNLVSETQYLGLTVSSAFVLLSSAVKIDAWWGKLLWFSPVSWITLNNIDVGGLTKNPPFVYCAGVLGGLIVILTAAVLIFGRKKSLDVKGE